MVQTLTRITPPTSKLLDSVGATKFLDKMVLADELIPAILELAAAGTRPS